LKTAFDEQKGAEMDSLPRHAGTSLSNAGNTTLKSEANFLGNRIPNPLLYKTFDNFIIPFLAKS
jgi:hypothetical protein